VPALADVVAALRNWPEVTAFVELKRHSIERFGARRVAEAVCAELLPVLDQCVIISFESNVLEVTRELFSVPIGWALRDWNASARRHAERLAPEYLFCNVTRLPAEPEPLWAGTWTWVVYEITDPAEAQRLLQRGVGLIETMRVAEMLAALGSRAWR
jgi:glycerophosphoryl diester phosphodiesterase